MESALVYILLFLKNREKKFKRKLKALRFFTQIYNPHQKNYIIVNTINISPNLYYIESEAFSEHN